MIELLTRPFRRRIEREVRKSTGIAVAAASLVPPWPRHFHVCLRTYHDVDKAGNFLFVTEFCSLITNDVELAKAQAIKLSGRVNVHVDKVEECADEAHVPPKDAPVLPTPKDWRN